MAEQSTYPTAPGEIKYPELPGDVPPSYEATMAGGAGKKFEIYTYYSTVYVKTKEGIQRRGVTNQTRQTKYEPNLDCS